MNRGYEYVFKFIHTLSSRKRRMIVDAIKTSPHYHRNYRRYGITWYELRSPRNQDRRDPPDATLFIETDFVYVMRKSKSVPMWKALASLQERIQDDLVFIAAGVYYACR